LQYVSVCVISITFAAGDVNKKRPGPKICNVAAQRLGVNVLHVCYMCVTYVVQIITFAGDDVDKKKPGPKIYNVAAQRLVV
jgi:beta-phosphoglucomutase-like phosphatase (HAD superfamily)